MSTYINESVRRLMEAITMINDPKVCEDLFIDLCTIKEIQNMAMRLDVARMIDQGVNYQKISEKTGASTATISRVSRSYYYGRDGYKKVIEQIKARED